MSFSDAPISFPGLFGDWQFTVPSKALNIGNGIYWYGIIIAAGMLLGLYFCMKQAPKYGLTEDNVIDTVLWVIPFSIIGARIYYVLFYLDLFRGSDGSINWSSTYRIWDGGLAIYGGVIAGFLTAYILSRCKKLSFWALTDCCVQGLFIGQAIGRWGNFMNREAFGAATELPWRMRLWTSATTYMDVHPTFLYESLWNVIGALFCCVPRPPLRRGEHLLLLHLVWSRSFLDRGAAHRQSVSFPLDAVWSAHPRVAGVVARDGARVRRDPRLSVQGQKGRRVESVCQACAAIGRSGRDRRVGRAAVSYALSH